MSGTRMVGSTRPYPRYGAEGEGILDSSSKEEISATSEETCPDPGYLNDSRSSAHKVCVYDVYDYMYKLYCHYDYIVIMYIKGVYIS